MQGWTPPSGIKAVKVPAETPSTTPMPTPSETPPSATWTPPTSAKVTAAETPPSVHLSEWDLDPYGAPLPPPPTQPTLRGDGRIQLPTPSPPPMVRTGAAREPSPVNLVPSDRSSEFARMDPADVAEVVGMMAAPEVYGPKALAQSLVRRLATRMALSGGGAALARGGVEAATPDLTTRRTGTPAGRMGTAAALGAGAELAGGVVEGAKVLRTMQGTREAAAELAGTAPPSVAKTLRDVTLTPMTRDAIDWLAGPPKVLPADPTRDLPEVNVGTFMGGDATAGQVRGGRLLQLSEGALRSTFGGHPIENQITASGIRLQREVESILFPLGTPPTERAAGQILLAPERARLTAEGLSEREALTRVHDAKLRQAESEEAAARLYQQAKTAEAAGAGTRSVALRAEADQHLKAAQQASEEATQLRRSVYGDLGPVRTEEEAGTITRDIHTAVEDARERAVDQAYKVVDDMARQAGVTVDLTKLRGRAVGIQAKTSDLQGAVNPAPTTLTSRVIQGSTVPEETAAVTGPPSVEALQQAINQSPDKIREAIASGQYRTERELMEAVLSLTAPEAEAGSQAQVISFTQARRARSELTRIAWRNRETNPALAATAVRLKGALSTSMESAAKRAGSEAWSALRQADQLHIELKQVFEEGILADLAGKDRRAALDFLLKRDSTEAQTVFNELGPEVQQALKSALTERILRDPVTGAWRTGPALRKQLNTLSPEIQRVFLGETAGTLGRIVERTTAGAAATDLAEGALKASQAQQTEALKLGRQAMAGERRAATAAERTQQVLTNYREALAGADKAAGTAEAKLDPIQAFQSLITEGTDPTKLDLLRGQVTTLLGPEAWGQVQARWLHDQLGQDLPKLLKRLQTFRPETVRALIPDAGIRNRVYALARVADHLGKYAGEPNRWYFFGQLFSTLSGSSAALLTGNPGKAAITVGGSFGVPYWVSRILADPHAGSALVAGMKAGELGDVATANKLLLEITRFLRREGFGGPGTLGGPPPRVEGPGPVGAPPSVGGRGAGPGPVGGLQPPPVVPGPGR